MIFILGGGSLGGGYCDGLHLIFTARRTPHRDDRQWEPHTLS